MQIKIYTFLYNGYLFIRVIKIYHYPHNENYAQKMNFTNRPLPDKKKITKLTTNAQTLHNDHSLSTLLLMTDKTLS